MSHHQLVEGNPQSPNVSSNRVELSGEQDLRTGVLSGSSEGGESGRGYPLCSSKVDQFDVPRRRLYQDVLRLHVEMGDLFLLVQIAESRGQLKEDVLGVLFRYPVLVVDVVKHVQAVR